MSDLIDRQAAIDDLMCLVKQHECDLMPDLLHWKGVKAMLESLPSAQSEIIRCRDCKNWDVTWTNDWSPEYHYCLMIDGVRKGDFYCAHAERRTDE